MNHPWWLAYARGTLSIALGLAVLYWPRIDVPTLVLLCGTFAVVDGIMIALIGFRIESPLMPLAGLIGLLVGAWLLSRPDFPEEAILFAIGVWAAVRGGFDIATSIQLRGQIPDEWLLMTKGVLLLVFGVLVSTTFPFLAALFPQTRVVVLVWMISVFALFEGALLMVLASHLRHAEPEAALRERSA